MRSAIVASILLLAPGCATNHSCCTTCWKWTGGLLLLGAVGVAEGAIDEAIDPEPEYPPNTDTRENRRKMSEWEAHQQEKFGRPSLLEFESE